MPGLRGRLFAVAAARGSKAFRGCLGLGSSWGLWEGPSGPSGSAHAVGAYMSPGHCRRGNGTAKLTHLACKQLEESQHSWHQKTLEKPKPSENKSNRLRPTTPCQPCARRRARVRTSHAWQDAECGDRALLGSRGISWRWQAGSG